MLNKLDDILVEGWRTAYKWLSVQLSLLTAIAAIAYEFLPAFKGIIPDTSFNIIMVIMVVFIIAGRLIKQKKNEPTTS